MGNWNLRGDTPGKPALVLGPIDNGHINPDKCKWRLSKGKRLTITLARANQNDMYKSKPRIPKIPDPDGKDDESAGGMLSVLAPFFIVLVAMAAYFMANGQR